MSKREKIILGAVAAAVAAAVYIRFPAPFGQEKALDLEKMNQELASFVTSTSAVVSQAKPHEQALYTIAMARKPWNNDPFLKTDEPMDLGKAYEITFPTFLYTGFVGMETKKVAVINGVEYEAGQELSPPGFELKHIYPDKVIIGVKGKNQETTVPLVEEVF